MSVTEVFGITIVRRSRLKHRLKILFLFLTSSMKIIALIKALEHLSNKYEILSLNPSTASLSLN
jgi:hypothetical protein